MIRYKKTNQQRLRETKFFADYCWVYGTTSTKGSHTKHGVWLHAKPLQQLHRWVLTFGNNLRKRHLKKKPRSFTYTWSYLPEGKYGQYMDKQLWLN